MKGTKKRLSILRTSTIAAPRCFGVWVDRGSSSLALHPFGLFIILMANSSFCREVQKIGLCLECLSLSSEAVCPRKDFCTVYMFFAVYFEYNINIFYFIHFSTAVVGTRCNQICMGHGKKESPKLAPV